jgi:hypothetical protein
MRENVVTKMLIKDRDEEDARRSRKCVFLPDDVILVHSARRWGFLTIKRWTRDTYMFRRQQKKTQFDSITSVLSLQTKILKPTKRNRTNLMISKQ